MIITVYYIKGKFRLNLLKGEKNEENINLADVLNTKKYYPIYQYKEKLTEAVHDDTQLLLEKIYEKFNNYELNPLCKEEHQDIIREQNARTSMTISDVVSIYLKELNQVTYWLCNAIGWKRLLLI